MTSSSLSSYFAQIVMMLASQAPGLIVFLVAIILALVFWRRCPLACLLTIVGCSVLIAAMVAYAHVTASVVSGYPSSRAGNMGRTLTIVGITMSIVRMAGYALLVAAIFVGRRPITRGFPVNNLDSNTSAAAE